MTGEEAAAIVGPPGAWHIFPPEVMPRPPEIARCRECGAEMRLTGRSFPHVEWRAGSGAAWSVVRPPCREQLGLFGGTTP